MKKELATLTEVFVDHIMGLTEKEIEARVVSEVAKRMKAVHAAFLGKPTEDEAAAAQPKNAATREKVRAGGGARAGRGIDKARKAAIIAEASKPGATLSAIEEREGLSRGLLSKWGVKKQRVPVPPRAAPKRRLYDDKFKRDIVATAGGLAPGDRETYLASEGVHVTLYYRWKKWAAKSRG